MKRLFSLAAATLLTTSLFAQKEETIEGNGKTVTRDIPVQSFDELKASGVYELKLSQGDKESVKIEADENLQSLFTVTNTGNTLVVDMKKLDGKNLKTKNKTVVYITFKNLKDLTLNMVGNVNTESQLSFTDVALNNNSVGNVDLKLTAASLKLQNKSVGNIKLSGKADNAVFRNTGVGNLRAGELEVQTMNVDNKGIGNTEVNATKDLKVKDSFLGKVTNRGAATVRRSNRVTI